MNTLPPLPAPVGALAAFDAVVAIELPCVSTAEYNSHEICKIFAENLRSRLAAIAAQAQPAASVEIGQLVTYEGETFTVVCRGDMTNTFDLHVFPRSRSGDQWRNVQETGLTKYVQPVQPTPPGWKLVPVSPTEEMIRAGVKEREGQAVYKCVSRAGTLIFEGNAAFEYCAMLAAAPEHGIGSPGASGSTTNSGANHV